MRKGLSGNRQASFVKKCSLQSGNEFGVLPGDDLGADLFGGGVVGCLCEAFQGEFLGGACAAAGDDVSVNHNAIGKELLAIEIHFATGVAGALAVLEEAGLAQDEGGGTDSENPLALGVKILEGLCDGFGCLEVLYAEAATGEAYGIEFFNLSGRNKVLEEGACLDGEAVGSSNIEALADGGQGDVHSATLPVVEGGHEFGFFKTVCHKEKNVHCNAFLCHSEGTK